MKQEYAPKRPFYLQIYQELLAQINQGTYPPGSKLPSEKELAEAYNVSRITSKKAMDTLAADGVISRTPGRGTFVLERPEAPQTPPSVPGNRLIGVIMEKFSSSFGGGLILGIEQECARRGYVMALRCTYHSKKAEVTAISQLLQLGAAGLIIMCVYDETYNPSILKLSLDNFPVVLVDREMSGIPLPCVTTDNHNAARRLTDFLFDQGHQRLTFVTAGHSFNTSTIKERAQGFAESCLEHGFLTDRGDWITNLSNVDRIPAPKEAQQKAQADREALKRYMEKHPQITGYLAASYDVGYLVQWAARQCADGIGRQVVCFDAPEDIFWPEPLVHIRQNQEEIGRTAVDQLLERIQGKALSGMTYIDYQFIK